jgi:hypothetical protein
LAKGYSCLLTNTDNIFNNKYNYDPDSDPIISALDIDWCGAEIAPGVSIKTTDELIKWIKEKSINNEQALLLKECKDLLTIIKDYLTRNNLSNLNKQYYWYAGAEEINEDTYPGSSTNWHLIFDTSNIISTGELYNEEKIRWIVAVPTALGLNHISNGEDITDIYDVTTVTCADGIEYKVFTQVDKSKKMDIEIIH